MSKSKMKKSLSILMASTMMVQPIVTMAENGQNGQDDTSDKLKVVEVIDENSSKGYSIISESLGRVEIKVADQPMTAYNTPGLKWRAIKGVGTDILLPEEMEKFKDENIKIKVYGNQREMVRTDTPNSADGARVDYPMSFDEANQVINEVDFWKGKERPTGKRLSAKDDHRFINDGPEEFLATEIFGYVFEQGVDKVLIKDIRKRFEIVDDGTGSEWKIVAIKPENLPNGIVYNHETGNIEGVIKTGLENGVFDMKTRIYISNGVKSYQLYLADLKIGWIGWKDTTKPKIIADNAEVKYSAVGKQADFSIEYEDNSGSTTGEEINLKKQWYQKSYPLTGVAGIISNGATEVDMVALPGASYSTEQGKIYGKLNKAGNFRLAVFAKDFDLTAYNNEKWNVSGQEAHSNMTILVKPTVEVLNTSAYSKELKVKVSEGATNMKITMPNKTVIDLVYSGKDTKNWEIVKPENGKYTVHKDGEYLKIGLPYTDTAIAGTDNVQVEAWSDDITMVLLRNEVMLNGADGKQHKATFSEKTGHWELEDDYKTVETTIGDKRKETNRQVYTHMDVNGGAEFAIYGYTRTYRNDGTLESVDVERPVTNFIDSNKIDTAGLYVTVTYDSINKEWKSSDGTDVEVNEKDGMLEVSTKSGFKGNIPVPFGMIADEGKKAELKDKLVGTDLGSIRNEKPTVEATPYNGTLNSKVNLLSEPRANVTISDTEDKLRNEYTKTNDYPKITNVSVQYPSGKVETPLKDERLSFNEAKEKVEMNVTLDEIGTYTVTVKVIDSNEKYIDAEVGKVDPGTEGEPESAVAEGSYKINVAGIVVNYVDEAGKEIYGPKTKSDVEIGKEYNTIDLRHEYIGKDEKGKNAPIDKAKLTDVGSNGPVYQLDLTKLPGNEKGTVENENNPVKYTYKEIKTGLTVKFVDEAGKALLPDKVEEDQSIGAPYDLTQHAKANEKISVGKKKYRRTQIEVEKTAVKPVDLKGNLKLNVKLVDQGEPVFEPTEVTYVYEEIKSNVTVHYLCGKEEIKDPVKATEQDVSVGTAYDVTNLQEKEITKDGKLYRAIKYTGDKPLNGEVGEKPMDIIFKYEEVKTSWTVNYVDDDNVNGDPIQKPFESGEVSVGSEYDLDGKVEKTIKTDDGKVYEIVEGSVPAVMKDKLTETPLEITLRYKEVKSAVVVNYVDEAGNKLVDAKIVMKDQSVGTHYDASTKEFKLPKITLSNGKVYKIVPKKTKGQLTGEVTKEKIDITFVYEEVKTDLVVKYVDESGNEIKVPVTVLKDVSCGTAYNVDTASLKPVKIVVDGKEYELVVEKTIGKMSGKLVDGGNEVRFVYRLVKKPGILPVIKHEEVKPNVPRTGDAVMGNSVIVWFMSVVSGLFGYKKLKDDEE